MSASLSKSKTVKFGHMADLHLGATSDPVLKKLEIGTLEEAINRCIEEDVDFLIIAGDLFHVNVPDLGVVKESVEAFMRFVKTGRKIYVVYGSHDFSPNSTSIIDILEAAGMVVRVGKPSTMNGLLRPEIVKDERSGAVLTGISGRRVSLEREAFINLDREYLSSLQGFKIFIFHSGIEEVKKEGEKYEGIASSDLPKGFDYYAGGHIHRRIEMDKGMKVIFPGPLFTGWGVDMEATVKGEKRGFIMAEAAVTGKAAKVSTSFVDLTPFKGLYLEVDATGMPVASLNSRLHEIAEKEDLKDKVAVVKVLGELASGKTSDVDFNAFRSLVMSKGALYLHLSRNMLHSKEAEAITFSKEEPLEIEEKVLRELEGTIKVNEPSLKEGSIKIAKELLSQLRVPKLEGETQDAYESRMSEAAIRVLGLKRLIEQ